MIWLKPPLLAPLQEGRRLIDAVGWAVILPQMLASLGAVATVICTQRFHLPRALFLAHAAGLRAVGLVADAHAYGGQGYNKSRETCASMRAVLDVACSRARSRA